MAKQKPKPDDDSDLLYDEIALADADREKIQPIVEEWERNKQALQGAETELKVAQQQLNAAQEKFLLHRGAVEALHNFLNQQIKGFDAKYETGGGTFTLDVKDWTLKRIKKG